MIVTVTMNASVDKLYVVDSLEKYEVLRVKKVNNTAGGKGLNVSRILAMTGEKVLAMGMVGGHNGKLFESLIKEPNIEPHFTYVQGETRCCINVWDVMQSKSTEFLEPGSLVTESETEQFVADYMQALANCDLVCISGSLPKGIRTDFYARLVTLAKQQGKQVLLDVPSEPLQKAVRATPTLIKPNMDEVSDLITIEEKTIENLADAVLKLHKDGIEYATVSMGKDGVLMGCEEGVFHSCPPYIKVVNTVGSGDSMIAGFAKAITLGYSPTEMLRYATAISAANTLTFETGSFKKEDLDVLLPQIKIRKLKDGTLNGNY